MAKRFTDTDIWDKEWYMGLSCKHKCLIRFLFDKCDVAGVWSVNYSLASSYIGEQITEADLKTLSTHVVKFSDSKFFIIDFIEFQYGTLSENCKPHAKVFSLLKKYNIDVINIKGYSKGIDTLQEEEEDKEKETEKEGGCRGGIKTEEEKPKIKIENQAALVPMMAAEFKKFNKNYPVNIEKDYPALREIAEFIAEQSGIKFELTEKFISDMMPYWRHLCDHIPKDSFYRNFSLAQIKNNIQAIVLKIQNGDSKPISDNTKKFGNKSAGVGILNDMLAELERGVCSVD